MSRIWVLAMNDLRLTVRDRPAFIWMLIMPIAFMWIFSNMGGGGGGQGKIALTIVNQDGGWLSEALVTELSEELFNLVDTQSEDTVRSLVIPDGFTEGVLAGEQQVLRFEKQPDSNEQYGFAAQVYLSRVVVRTLATVIEMQQTGTLDGAYERFRSLDERPPLVSLSVSTAGTGAAVPSGAAQSVPGTLTFSVMMMTLIYGAVFLTTEKTSGMLRRQAGAPLNRRRIFAGKLIGRLLMAMTQTAILVLVGRFMFGVSWGNSVWGLIVVLAAFCFAVASLSVMLGALLSTPEQASAVGWITGMVLAALGGCWWPGELTPTWMQHAAHMLPTAWAMDGLHALISFGHGLAHVVMPGLVLVGFGLLFSAIGARYLRFE
jgi:ABC-2 type transport system permease protein